MRNSESGLSATSASSENRSCTWLCAAVTIVSPASIVDPAESGTREAPRKAATSPTAKTTLPASPKATFAARTQANSTARRTNGPGRPFMVSLLLEETRRSLELIAHLHRADMARILEKLQVRCVVCVLILGANAPARADEIQRTQGQCQVAIAPGDFQEWNRCLIAAFDVADPGIDCPEGRR